jgi:uncharacterized protein (DUF302 family)
MTIRHINVQRFSVVSTRSFDEVVARIDAQIGHPEMSAFRKSISATKTDAEVVEIIGELVGSAGLMEFVRFDLGKYLRKELGTNAPKMLRLVAGNPIIMKQMVKHIPDAGSYAPVTILIDERPDGVHLSYDRMASFLAPYGSPEAMKVAQDLDAKVETLLTAAAN